LKQFTRRSFFKIGGAGAAAAATLPLMERVALAHEQANYFTVAVISDTQNYCDGTYNTPTNFTNRNFFKEQATYLAQNAKKLKLRFASHVGDVVQHGDGTPTGLNFTNLWSSYTSNPTKIEWQNATDALDILDAADIPFALVPGNHDYDNYSYTGSVATGKEPPLIATSACWTNYFGSQSKYFKRKHWYGGASDSVGYVSTGDLSAGNYFAAGTKCNYGLSSYQIFSGGGKMFLHIALEMEAGDNAIAWAQKVIDKHYGYATIVTTHSYLAPPAWGDNAAPLAEAASYNTASYLVNSPNGYNGAADLFTKLIKYNPQIFLVLCGHSWTSTSSATNKYLLDANGNPVVGVSRGENYRIDYNIEGYPVYQVLSDYQGNTQLGSAGGDGWYRFMQFDLTSKLIHFYTINSHESLAAGKPVLAGQSALYANSLSDFGQPAAFSDFSLAVPQQVLRAPKSDEFDHSDDRDRYEEEACVGDRR
jgi:hypothetical protein